MANLDEVQMDRIAEKTGAHILPALHDHLNAKVQSTVESAVRASHYMAEIIKNNRLGKDDLVKLATEILSSQLKDSNEEVAQAARTQIEGLQKMYDDAVLIGVDKLRNILCAVNRTCGQRKLYLKSIQSVLTICVVTVPNLKKHFWMPAAKFRDWRTGELIDYPPREHDGQRFVRVID